MEHKGILTGNSSIRLRLLSGSALGQSRVQQPEWVLIGAHKEVPLKLLRRFNVLIENGCCAEGQTGPRDGRW
ncbi:hypothetical protein E2C01_045461 [Portunus trituberculatus]|uniref:Uncharacterized protein n=1 Tax=Portunus trituberculatus TaxID=210409 RepID=A0A5B7FYF4_PORTR|nr:hypothetical protein [Portunus trituberculatus]